MSISPAINKVFTPVQADVFYPVARTTILVYLRELSALFIVHPIQVVARPVAI
jgi:hypothetical protein